MIKQSILQAARLSGFMAFRRAVTKNQFRIVTYHGVDAAQHPVINFDRLQTAPELFTRQVEQLARQFKIVSFKDAVAHYRHHRCWPQQALAITFDDGYRNNLEQAAPILQRLGVTATFFVTAGFIDGRVRPWWYHMRALLAARGGLSEGEKIAEAVRLEAMSRPMAETERRVFLEEFAATMGATDSAPEATAYPFMTRVECRKLLTMGFDVQAHGDTHASFAGETPERVNDEIRRSVQLVREIGHAPWAMAYPYGHEPHDPAAARKTMIDCGLVAAVTTCEGGNGRASDLYALRRHDLHGGYTPLAAVFKLS